MLLQFCPSAVEKSHRTILFDPVPMEVPGPAARGAPYSAFGINVAELARAFRSTHNPSQHQQGNLEYYARAREVDGNSDRVAERRLGSLGGVYSIIG